MCDSLFSICILLFCSEFEELEAVPSLSVMEGPLEPTSTTTTATDAPEDPSFENYFSVCTIRLSLTFLPIHILMYLWPE